MKKIVFIVCTIVVALSMTSCKPSTPSHAVDAFFEAMKAGDFEQALNYTDMKDQEKALKQIEMMKEIDFKVQDFEILSEKILDDGQNAVVKVRYTATSAFSKKPDENTNDYELVKVDGKWLIHE
ncbi:MAG: DUF4878 domain-containing protein [Bacteroidales bacterium]|nr:DUF4878 domain-containing protein [Bacteroidales bacterium]